MARFLFIVCTLGFSLAGAAQAKPVLESPPGLYVLKSTPEGKIYLGSELLTTAGQPDFSTAMLDNALDLSESEVAHVPTSLVFAKDDGMCKLVVFAGLPVPSLPNARSFQGGGLAFYACRPETGIPFIYVSFEKELKTQTFSLPDFSKNMLYMGMGRPGAIGDMDCETNEDPMFRMDCKLAMTLSDRPVHQYGRFYALKSGFVKINYACLAEDCTISQGVVDNITSAILRNHVPQSH